MIDWPAVVKQHSPIVWQTAYRLLGNHADASDCFQETFTCALNHHGNFPPAFNLKTLLDLPPQTDWDTKKFALRAVTFVQLHRTLNADLTLHDTPANQLPDNK